MIGKIRLIAEIFRLIYANKDQLKELYEAFKDIWDQIWPYIEDMFNKTEDRVFGGAGGLTDKGVIEQIKNVVKWQLGIGGVTGGEGAERPSPEAIAPELAAAINADENLDSFSAYVGE